MRIIIHILIIAILVFILYYNIKNIMKLDILAFLYKDNKKLGVVYSIMILSIICVVITMLLTFINFLIILIVFTFISLILDLTKYIVNRKKTTTVNYSYLMITSLSLTLIYLIIGWYGNNNVVKTEYNLSTNKDIKDIKIIALSDAHIGTSFSGEKFNDYIDEINKEKADALFIIGDFVDDSTSRKDLEDAAKALSRVDTEYGTYFVFGNHDKGYSKSMKKEWNYNDLMIILSENNVRILEDEVVLIDDNFYIVGRKDAQTNLNNSERKDIDALLNDLDRDKYIIVLNHQPTDYEAESKSGVDLVLSGHTHGGQFFPFNYLGELFNLNNSTYGLKKINDTNFIVSSGISAWEVRFKTGFPSEYIIINIT